MAIEGSSFWDWAQSHLDSITAAVFGAGVTWGALRSRIADHGTRITKLEIDGPAALKRLEDKMDQHHSQTIGLMMDIATRDSRQNRRPP